MLALSYYAHADVSQEAYRVYNRLNGVPPSSQVLTKMVDEFNQGNSLNAALIAIDDEQGRFYRSTVRKMVAPWTNESGAVRVPLNDFTATVMGIIRDELPYHRVLWDDIIYTVDAPLPDYSLRNNDHYQQAEEQGLDLRQKLKLAQPSLLTRLNADTVSGVLTSYSFARAFYNAGTNRAAVRFSFKPFLCMDVEQLSDVTRPDNRVRRDVSRAPGGDSSVYKSKCVGCHAGMDALAGAFAYLDYNDDDGLIFNPLAVGQKFNRNEHEFPYGYITHDDSWKNLWVHGPNHVLGWKGQTEGSGVKSYGYMLSQSQQFARCSVTQVLSTVCQLEEGAAETQSLIDQLSLSFAKDYNLKRVFAQAALACRGS